jgi:hypothetical protein
MFEVRVMTTVLVLICSLLFFSAVPSSAASPVWTHWLTIETVTVFGNDEKIVVTVSKPGVDPMSCGNPLKFEMEENLNGSKYLFISLLAAQTMGQEVRLRVRRCSDGKLNIFDAVQTSRPPEAGL